VILGIDPGLNGALAFFDVSAGRIEVVDMPTIAAGTNSKRVVDEAALASCVEAYRGILDHAYVERVGAMPGQGVTSMFSFGRSFGVALGVLAAFRVPVTLVQPQRWKAALSVPAAKDGARARASQLMPAHARLWPLVKHDGRAEAALIAYYGVSHARR
jgi:crossover junction endodeoxyribonuclease RuvC